MALALKKKNKKVGFWGHWPKPKFGPIFFSSKSLIFALGAKTKHLISEPLGR